MVLSARYAELERRATRIRQLEMTCDALSVRVVRGERELDGARAELARLRAESESGMRSLAALAEELEAVRAQARGQATRIRLRALRDAVEIGERTAELGELSPGGRERLLDSLEAAIARLGTEEADREDEAPADSNGHRPRRAGEVFAGAVEIEVGPLEDFSQLVGFEDAAGAIGATREISVKRFASGRATLAMNLGEPVELLRELEERSPFEFKVRDQRADRVVLDVDGEQTA